MPLLSVFGIFEEFNDATVLFLSGIPKWSLIILALLGIGVLVLSWVDLRDLAGRRRNVLISIRTIAICLALAFLLEPALELRNVTRIPNHVAILVDSSLSMTLPHDDDQSRWERALEFVADAESLFSGDDDEHIFELYLFDSEPRPLASAEPLAGLEANGSTTLILEALEEISRQYPRHELGGVVLLSDGTDAGSLAGRMRRGESLDAQTRSFVESLGVPIHTMALGHEDVQDIAVEHVLVDDFAFVRNRIEIEVVVRTHGFEEGFVPVTLRRQGEVIQTREIQLSEEQSEYRVTFEFIPQQIGKEIYSVSLPVLNQEILAENNDAFFILKVIRDKIRVLQVCGRPSWDERFLRELLKRNPNVDLISFFILRTDESLHLVPDSELSLIPFPTEELFEEQLGSFDLVIFQNFTYRPYGMTRYLPRIEEYVRQGGAFVMIGGEQAFASGGYGGTPIASLIPVFLPPTGPEDVLIDETPFQPVLTSAGYHHPITQLDFSQSENSARWSELPELDGTNIVLASRPEATVLLEHPSLTAAGEPLAVLSVMDYVDGRSMAFTSDSSWRWSFASVGNGGTSRGYTAFWNSAIRWLIQDPELKLIQVETPGQHVEPNSNVDINIRVFQPDYEPAVEVSGTWELRYQPLDRLDDDSAIEIVDTGTFVTDERGRVDLELLAERPGSYEVQADAELETAGSISDSDIFLCLRANQELRDILPRPQLLSALSEASSNEAESDDSLHPNGLYFNEARTVQVNRRRILTVWSSPWVLGVLALLLAAEWTLRRRWGHL